MVEDIWNWRGCDVVRFDPERLGGRATVGETRMDADGIMLNYEDGLSAEEISEAFDTDLATVRSIIAFGTKQVLRAEA